MKYIEIHWNTKPAPLLLPKGHFSLVIGPGFPAQMAPSSQPRLSITVLGGDGWEALSESHGLSPTYHQAGWWFQTWLLFSIIYIYINMGYFSHWLSYFSRWLKHVKTTNQQIVSIQLPWIAMKLDAIWYHISGQTHVSIMYEMIIHVLFVQLWVLLRVDASCRWIHHGGYGSLDQHARQIPSIAY